MMSLRLKLSALAPSARSHILFETNDEAASGASVAASVANFDMNVPADFFDWEALRKTEMFQELFRKVQLAVTPGKEDRHITE